MRLHPRLRHSDIKLLLQHLSTELDHRVDTHPSEGLSLPPLARSLSLRPLEMGSTFAACLLTRSPISDQASVQTDRPTDRQTDSMWDDE